MDSFFPGGRGDPHPKINGSFPYVSHVLLFHNSFRDTCVDILMDFANPFGDVWGPLGIHFSICLGIYRYNFRCCFLNVFFNRFWMGFGMISG